MEVRLNKQTPRFTEIEKLSLGETFFQEQDICIVTGSSGMYISYIYYDQEGKCWEQAKLTNGNLVEPIKSILMIGE